MPQRLSSRRTLPHFFTILISFLSLAFVTAAEAQTQTNPELLTYEELVQLYEQATPPEPLQQKLATLLTTPFVSNSAAQKGIKPLKPQSPALGSFLRVAFWNIERGLQYEAVEGALGGSREYVAMLHRTRLAHSSATRSAALKEAALLSQADVIVLNEVDWGMNRTDYRNVIAELAAALRMNYAYGVEFVEVDPIALGRENFDDVEATNKAELLQDIKVDTSKYKGLHGNAILSRYRLENVRLQPFVFQGHDWYEDEKKSVAPVEKGKRKAAEQIFLEKIYREVRRGGRTMLQADLVDPEIPGGRVTIVATHLEDRTTPKKREKQLQELVERIKDIKNPVVLAGDMNTTGEDSTPTSLKREVTKRLGSKSFWIHHGIGYALGVGIVKDVVIGGVKFVRNQSDPTVKHVPIIAPNPAAGFFETLKDFRFSDGNAFDFRGERERSIGQSNETLGNSNERGSKGFVTTFEVERKLGTLGKFKLDWFFVKPPALSNSDDDKQPHVFAPHFGRTLKTLNYSLEDRISDHSPILVDLPFGEPRLAPTPERPRQD